MTQWVRTCVGLLSQKDLDLNLYKLGQVACFLVCKGINTTLTSLCCSEDMK